MGNSEKSLILLTGATGKIGSRVLEALLLRGYHVRALTSRGTPEKKIGSDRRVDWHIFDLHNPKNTDDLMRGCIGVVHLAAEMHDANKMWQSNALGTRALAEAAERESVKSFCYASSVAVYGSAICRFVDEGTRTLTLSEDIKSEYWGNYSLRAYGRSKSGGELAIQESAKETSYVMMRPTVVVSVEDVLAIRDWSALKKNFAAHRHSHHIFVDDVADALIWGLERGLTIRHRPGNVEIYNLSDEDHYYSQNFGFLRRAYNITGDKKFYVFKMPAIADWVKDFLKVWKLPIRNPLWRMYFSNQRLVAAGYILPQGMGKIYDIAFQTINDRRQ